MRGRGRRERLGTVSWLLAIGCWLLALRSADSQQPTADSQSPVAAGSELTISVLTMGQGDAVWERFGHNALRIQDAALGTDVAYNWGTFDFDQPNFVGRFLTGNTLYWLDSIPTGLMVEYYRRELNRSIVEQRLELTPAQRVALRDYVAWNVRPENRNYRYDYFLDNCSTRLRDVIDRALGGALRAALAPVPSALTFRSETERLTAGMPLTVSGIHVALGEPADRRMSAWEEGFVPMRLRDRLREVRVRGEDGTARPLVAEERVLYTASRAAEAAEAPSLLGRFLVAGLLLAGLLAWSASRAARGSRGGRAAFATLGAVWGLLTGTMGIVLALAWGVTRHEFWYDNENLLQLAPIAILLVVLVPLAVYRPAWRRAALGVAAAMIALSLLGLLLKPLPAFEQRNLAVALLALPAHVALLWGLRRVRAPGGG